MQSCQGVKLACVMTPPPWCQQWHIKVDRCAFLKCLASYKTFEYQSLVLAARLETVAWFHWCRSWIKCCSFSWRPEAVQVQISVGCFFSLEELLTHLSILQMAFQCLNAVFRGSFWPDRAIILVCIPAVLLMFYTHLKFYRGGNFFSYIFKFIDLSGIQIQLEPWLPLGCF